MLETIEKNGEFENYVEMLADREDRERKELRRRDRERRKLAYGDQFVSESESEEVEEEEESDWMLDSEEEVEEMDSPDVTDFNVNQNGLRINKEQSVARTKKG